MDRFMMDYDPQERERSIRDRMLAESLERFRVELCEASHRLSEACGEDAFWTASERNQLRLRIQGMISEVRRQAEEAETLAGGLVDHHRDLSAADE